MSHVHNSPIAELPADDLSDPERVPLEELILRQPQRGYVRQDTCPHPQQSIGRPGDHQRLPDAEAHHDPDHPCTMQVCRFFWQRRRSPTGVNR